MIHFERIHFEYGKPERSSRRPPRVDDEARQILEDAYTPEATRADLVNAVSQAIDALSDEDEDDEDEDVDDDQDDDTD